MTRPFLKEPGYLGAPVESSQLILATRNARNEIAGIEEEPDAEIEKAKEKVLQRAD
jgi:hypothetical protein